jgi:hypothetical protein
MGGAVPVVFLVPPGRLSGAGRTTYPNVKEQQNVGDIPSGVYGTIRLALESNLRYYHRRYPDDIDGSDLWADIVTAVKWVHETSPQTAVYLVQSALTNVSTDEDGPALEDVARCLRHSLTQASAPYGNWTPEEADHFVTAALIAR